jgi:pimeloyl-ACP methyl ester carboxylesterase
MHLSTKTISSSKYNFQYLDEGTDSMGFSPILFLHGMAGGKEATWQMFSDLAKKHRCIHLDLPGHNNLPIDGFNTMDDFAGYVVDFINTLNLKDFYIVGFSLGGLLASEIANLDSVSNKIKGIVIWASPVLGIKKGVHKRARTAYSILKQFPDQLFSAICSWEYLEKARKVVGIRMNKVEADLTLKFPLKSRLQVYKIIEKWNYKHNYTIPKLFVYGADDPIVNKENPLFISKCMDKTCKTIVLPRAGHYGSRKAWDEALIHVNSFVDVKCN